MTRSVGWEDMEPLKSQGGSSGTGGSNNIFMVLKEGKNRIRLYGDQMLMMNIVWINKKRYIIPEEYLDRVRSLKLNVTLHYAVNCLDREDTNNNIYRFKILERGKTVFETFRAYNENMEDDEGNPINPAGLQGPDWLITVETPVDPTTGKQDARRRTYTVMPLKREKLRREEKELILRTKKVEENKDRPLGERGLMDLRAVYKLDSAAEKLEEALQEYSQDGGSEIREDDAGDVGSPKQPKPKEEKKEESSAVPNPEDMDETELDKLLEQTF